MLVKFGLTRLRAALLIVALALISSGVAVAVTKTDAGMAAARIDVEPPLM